MAIWKEELNNVKQCPQRQDSLTDQLKDLYQIANKFGLYDAADFVRKLNEIYFIDKCVSLEKKLLKAIEILGSNTSDICPQEYGLANKDNKCPEHFNCKRCWEEALENINTN